MSGAGRPHRVLDVDEAKFGLLANKLGATRLGFASMLKVFEQEVRFPKQNDLAKTGVKGLDGRWKTAPGSAELVLPRVIRPVMKRHYQVDWLGFSADWREGSNWVRGRRAVVVVHGPPVPTEIMMVRGVLWVCCVGGSWVWAGWGDASSSCSGASTEVWFRWVPVPREVIVLASEKRDLAATRRFFTRALRHSTPPTAVTTDRAPAYPLALDELVPTACHVTEKYANNPIEPDRSRLKSRLRPKV